MSFDVLFVCTGNLCRSPMAERLFIARTRPDADLLVHSAGTRAVVGYGMDPASADVTRLLGADPEGHVATQLRGVDIERAGLVLTATTEHRAKIVQESPSAMRRVFTMREFAHLARGVELPAEDDLAARVRAVAAQRGQVDPLEPGAADIADPIGQSLPVVEQVGRQVAETVDRAVRALGISA